MKNLFLFILTIIFSIQIEVGICSDVSDSPLIISGTVIDSETKEPLAFVSIIYNSKNQGITTGIDGRFFVTDDKPVEFLKFVYLGYETKNYQLNEIPKRKFVIEMKRIAFNLKEVTVESGENPAHRIIKAVFKNRKINAPEHLESFSYQSYNKLTFDPDWNNFKKRDTGKIKRRNDSISKIFIEKRKHRNDSILKSGKDSSYIRNLDSIAKIKSKRIADSVIHARNKKKAQQGKDTSGHFFKQFKSDDDFLNQSHIFIIESVSERKFKFPDRNDEKIIASRISGLQNASFILLATQLQSFSFYNEFVKVGEKSYVSPISRGSTGLYFFNIVDTSYTTDNDSVFVLSFKPRRNSNFEGLKGTMQVNTNKYAIQTIIAEPAETQMNTMMTYRVQQLYEFIDKKQWFPVQLNTTIIFKNAQIGTKDGETNLIGNGKSYLTDIKINPELKRSEFSGIDIQMLPNAMKQTDSVWKKYRYDTLSKKDKQTYAVMDSVGKVLKLDQKIWLIQTLSNGYIPWKFINFNLDKLFAFNQYEGFRAGLGIVTNDRLSRNFYISGYGAYGFNDKQFKYGVETGFKFWKRKDVELGFSYTNDVQEIGAYDFKMEKQTFLASVNSYRKLYINNMTPYTKYQANLKFRVDRNLKMNVFYNQYQKRVNSQYTYTTPEMPSVNFTNHFNSEEAGVSLRWAYHEKLIETPLSLIAISNDAPVLYVNITKGLKWQTGEFDYLKFEAKLVKTFRNKRIGPTKFQITGGYATGNAPVCNLYNGISSYANVFGVNDYNSFNTMRMNEFFADRFFHVFFSQYLRNKPINNKKKFNPEIVLVTNLGFGEMKSRINHTNFNYSEYSKGYYESGLIFNNLYRPNPIYGIGLGIYYRYGDYSFTDWKENIAIKMTLSF